MELTTQRFSDNGNSTLSLFFINCEFKCYNLEDEFRSVKVKGETRIPAGRYPVKLRTEGGFHERYLKRFGADFHKGMLHITEIPNFKYVLIHILNNEKQTDGCLGVGNTINNNQVSDAILGDSTNAYKTIYPIIRDALLAGEEVWINVKDEGQIDFS